MQPTGRDRGDGLRVERATKTLRELTLDKMREAILTSHFKPGERLVERDLCAQLGVSRTIVREVLRHLESEGLVTSLANRGPIVARTSREEAWQIYEIRASLEAMAAAACAADPDDAAISELQRHLKSIEQAYARKTPSAVLEATSEFYRVLFEAAGHTIAWGIVSSLMLRINQLRSLTIADSNRDQDGPREMRAVVDAIAARDPAAAATAARTHVMQAAAIARRIIEVRDRTAPPE
ncbi:GntR family transcriptional regulator [Pseudohoeflea coraliihabitans]|uniref:GntR family transcriptional regulator n=1 Tax=Pseudohoeflea coraliihabitans TaxID=2860393 RepID=A0ABS6WIS1_9HYPH|nr:GntR family transcriptional regulator [Pseudohoeflea sp. DP4N28-3]MBW3095833.1 GntR family transcriptional regulator [Pseudohoeflea sp. DP4N28-3]